MRGPLGLICGIVRPLGVVGFRVHRFVGSDIRITEEIAGRDDDVTEYRDVVDGS